DVDEQWCADPAFANLESRLAAQDRLDAHLAAWTARHDKFAVEKRLQAASVPVAPVLKPEERIDLDPSTGDFGLWPEVRHSKMGDVRVDGQPVHFSRTDWHMERGAPCLGEHNEEVFTRLLGMSAQDVEQLRQEGVI
ncbi:MAG: CoA transferase, partial [Gammaproteobacteria bacterium]|nr:CoA transferase [Gammaproteobacteria bacterium]